MDLDGFELQVIRCRVNACYHTRRREARALRLLSRIRMQIICAWCRREGRPALLGHKPPFDDPSETHSVCERHRRRVLDALEAESFPGVRLLVVVGARERALYDYLTRALAGLQDVAVIIERRERERRRPGHDSAEDRRRRDRRQRRAYAPTTWYRYVRFGRPATE